MAKPARAEPTPLQPDTTRIELNGDLAGHWTVITREPTGRQLLAMLSGQFAEILHVIEQRTIEHSFGGDIMDQPAGVLVKVVNAWTAHERGLALDPTRASGSSKRR